MEWTPDEIEFFKTVNTPEKIQRYLDKLIYNTVDAAISPRYVMMTGDGHCFEGALFAAAALEQIGFPPLLVDLQAHDWDDPHVIAVYKTKTGWGSLAKSNTSLLAGRLPVYRSIRELVMSYFDFYFDVEGRPSLYAYSDPINLNRYNYLNWRTTDEDLVELGISFSDLDHFELLSIEELESLPVVAQKLKDACFLGANPDGFYRLT